MSGKTVRRKSEKQNLTTVKVKCIFKKRKQTIFHVKSDFLQRNQIVCFREHTFCFLSIRKGSYEIKFLQSRKALKAEMDNMHQKKYIIHNI